MSQTKIAAKDLEMPHLQELKKEVEQSVTSDSENQTSKQPEKPDPRGEREYTFQFKWANGHGKTWEGKFTNKILSIRERQLAGLLRARLAGGMPVESLDELTGDINLMLSHMAYSLIEKPKWAQDLTALEDVRLLTEIYMEVLDHEDYFLGYRTDQAES